MSDIPGFPYADLWGERQIVSVANLTRDDGLSFFDVAEQAPIRTVTETFALEEANIALERLRSGRLTGAAVLVRSEEHTSELQSLMRISYAVFCLKKKNTQLNKNYIIR